MLRMKVLPMTFMSVAFPAGCPEKSIFARPITPVVYGTAFSQEAFEPADTQTSWPLSAMAGAPNTGTMLDSAA